MNAKTLLASIGVGAGLMYFMDPTRGERRRAMVRDRVTGLINSADDSINDSVWDLRNRTRGTLAEMAARVGGEGAPDWILEERVRSMLGRVVSHPRAVQVIVKNGRVTLSGSVLGNELDRLIKRTSGIRGVRDVDNQLMTYEDPSSIPSLQGTSQRRDLTDGSQAAWSPSVRLLAGAGGGLLALMGLTRRSLFGLALSAAGLYAVARGVTNLDARSMLGLGMGSKAILVNKAINVNAPIHEVYTFWSNFENFPLFMSHVKEVANQDGTTHWRVAGPAGSTFEFNSYVTQDIPNQLIAWETDPDSQVRHTGFVRFDPNRDGSTRVTVQMRYIPPAGVAGHAVAKLFGVDPRQSMNEDLARLKSLLETGKTSTGHTEVHLGTMPTAG